MGNEMKGLLEGLDLNPGASESDLRQVEAALAVVLPLEYVDLMRYSNGAEGPIGASSYLVLWPIEEIIPLNEDYAAGEFAPGLILFGTDGGGEGYAFDTRSAALPIVAVPLVGISLDEATLRGRTFGEFLRNLHSS